MSREGRAGPVTAALVALALLATAWAGLYEGVGGGRLLVLCLVGALPTIAALSPRARGAAVLVATIIAVPLALALAMRVSAWQLFTLDHDAWAAVADLVPDGLSAGSHSSLPVSPGDEPALVALLDAALALLAAAAAWQIVVRRRAVAGLVIVGAGLAYRWTVAPPTNGVAAGGMALGALAIVLALSGWSGAATARPLRHLGGALVLGALTVAVAAGLGAGPARAGDPWWQWRTWDLGSSSDPSAGGLDLRQRYGALDWPTTPHVVLTVATDRARPLRAVSLGEFDGVAFTLAEDRGSAGLVADRGTIAIPGTNLVGPQEPVKQDVTLVGATSPVVIASGRPVSVSGPFSGAASLVGDALRVQTPLTAGDSYRVRTNIPEPTPADLVAAGDYPASAAPRGSTRLRPSYWGAPVDLPLWGTSLPQPADSQLGPYAGVRALARRVVGDAATPYAAVNRVEAYLRSGYVYDERPPFPTSLPADWPVGRTAERPPLADFLLNSRRGFCQHFAGGMAVMLRSVGIPARVAVGYTGGSYDSDLGRYRVLDRDAHSWVEVWFPQYGWLPFDPTPGRSAPNPASVSSPDYSPSALEIDASGLTGAAVAPPPPVREAPATSAGAAAPDPATPAGGAGGDGGPGWRWALLLLLVPLGVVPARRRLRRLRGRRGGDERSRVVAAARELEASLAPLGFAPPDTASGTERAAAIRSRTGVDVSHLYRRAGVARFSPSPPPPGEAEEAWRELARVRREILRGTPRGRRLLAAVGIPLPVRDTVVRHG